MYTSISYRLFKGNCCLHRKVLMMDVRGSFDNVGTLLVSLFSVTAVKTQISGLNINRIHISKILKIESNYFFKISKYGVLKIQGQKENKSYRRRRMDAASCKDRDNFENFCL
jgi:hypothetical protein